MSTYLHLEKKNHLAIVRMDHPGQKVNTLNMQLIDEFEPLLNKIEADTSIKAVILMSAKPDTFIAGADLEVLRSMKTPEDVTAFNERGNALLDRIEALKIPVIAAMHGAALGGGLEVALACHYRIATEHKHTKFGLPEVKLGLLPGGGGTQRLTRKVGIQKALDLMLTGKNVYPRQAKRMGLVDVITHRFGLQDAAEQMAEQILAKSFKRLVIKRPFMQKMLEGPFKSIVFSQAKKMVKKTTYGNYPAPLKILECVKVGATKGVKAGRKVERDGFTELVFSPESKALVGLFFAMQDAKKNPDASKARPVRRLGMLGAGLMGSGIAQVSAENGGYNVVLKDRDLESAARGKKYIWQDVNAKVKKRIMPQFEADQLLSKITPSGEYDLLAHADIVIEAVFEDVDIKHKVLAEIEANAPETCIFASNTSSLPISSIAAKAARPEHVIGMHYFSPVQKMPLLEIIKTDKTADWVTATAYEVGMKQGKTVIVVNDGPGFYTTRILAPYMNEAMVLLNEGASIQAIDQAMRKWGFPVGPVKLMDEVGLDVASHVSEVMSDMFKKRGLVPVNQAEELSKAGFKGKKNQKGFYTYQAKGDSVKSAGVNEAVYSFFGGTSRKSIKEDEIQWRMAAMMINEAAYCLQENILLSPRDGDLGAILGLGFPPFRGGPFRFLDEYGTGKFVSLMEDMAKRFGQRFEPAPILKEYADKNARFYS